MATLVARTSYSLPSDERGGLVRVALAGSVQYLPKHHGHPLPERAAVEEACSHLGVDPTSIKLLAKRADTVSNSFTYLVIF